MLSALRKLTKKQDEKPVVFPMGVALVDQNMQKKYARGVQYNMKIIIKGDRNTGKTMLLQRLAGSKFKEEYIPTQEIQVANINWNYKGAGDIVKVEVWDIVDKSRKKRTPSGSLKITNDDSETKDENPGESLSLDAEFIDVYKGTHGVLLTMDVTKAWTWQYVQRELEKIPNHIPVLILANFRDMGDHRVISKDEILAYIEHKDRPTGSAEVYFAESSMKDGFGLHFIYKFINMPFLLLQRESLLRQLEVNSLDIDDTREMLTVDFTSEEQNYDLFKEMLFRKQNPTLQPTQENSEVITNEDSDPSSLQQQQQQQQFPTVELQPSLTKHQQTVIPEDKPEPKQLPVATVPPTVVTKESPKVSKFAAYKAKLFGGSSNREATPDVARVEPTVTGDVVPIEDFNPGQLDDSFLNDNSNTREKPAKKLKEQKLDSDDSDDGNPMVAAYEDFDSDSEGGMKSDLFVTKTPSDVINNNDDESDDDFDDLSDDERKDVASSPPKKTLSIMEKVKANKKLQKEQKEKKSEEITFVSKTELDVQDNEFNTPDYDNLDDDDDFDGNETIVKSGVQPDIDPVVDEPTENSTNKQSPKMSSKIKGLSVASNIRERTHVNDDDNYMDEPGDNPYVISGDVDVIDDLINEKDSEDDDEEETQQSQTENKLDDETLNSSKNQATLQFNLDDLEAFMSDQMTKVTFKADENEPTESQEINKPKKKKKKKTESSESSVSPEKRKSKKSKDTADSEDSSKAKKKTESATKTKKPKKSADTSSSDSTKKTKKSMKKKSTGESELDAFFAS